MSSNYLKIVLVSLSNISRLYAIIETIILNPCWFHVTNHIPVFTLSVATMDILIQFNSCLMFIASLPSFFVVYFNFIFINLKFVYVTVKRCLEICEGFATKN